MKRPHVDLPLVTVTIGMLIITLSFAAYFADRRHLTDSRAKVTSEQVAALRQAVCEALAPVKVSQVSSIAQARAFPFPADDRVVEPLCSPRLPFKVPAPVPSPTPRKIRVTITPAPGPTVTVFIHRRGPTRVVTEHPKPEPKKPHRHHHHTPKPKPCTGAVGICLPSSPVLLRESHG